ncbi:MAG: hypothetical protein BWY68_00897 [bacterium ADurb.Bin400]|nr:MAG: hypothetical protein BWY68_00897 [bacterium ADurb.Bin400]
MFTVLPENRVEAGNYRLVNIFQKGQNIITIFAAKDAVLMLKTYNLDRTTINMVGSPDIRLFVELINLKYYFVRVRIVADLIAHRNYFTGVFNIQIVESAHQRFSKRGDSTFPGRIGG